MPHHAVVLCAAPTGNEVPLILARGLLEARLSACVNILPIRSVYRWLDHVQDDPEVQLLIKTRAELFGELEPWIRHHIPMRYPR
jgi:periplasmic divalent cation tolerance protein